VHPRDPQPHDHTGRDRDGERDALGELHARGELDRTVFQEMMRELDLDDERLR
jgi:hypothetical protein